MILPVYIKNVRSPYGEVLVYALLDSQSDTTFVSDRALRMVGAHGKDTQIQISTMTSKDKTVNCKKCDHLAVRGYGSNVTI